MRMAGRSRSGMKRSKGCSSGAGGFGLAAGLESEAGAGAAVLGPAFVAGSELTGAAGSLALAVDAAGVESGPGLAGLELSVTGLLVGGCCGEL